MTIMPLTTIPSSLVADTIVGAAGDGSTDDTAAFTTFETAHAGQDVDLNGRTYEVTAAPAGNRYHNGKFRLSKTATISGASYGYTYDQPARGVPPVPPSTSLLRDARGSLSRATFVLTKVEGLQSFTVDEVGAKVYAMHLTGSGATEVSYVSQYAMSPGSAALAAAGTSNGSAQLGHQGLSLEYRNNGTVKLWGAVRYEATNFPNGHRQAIRFDYNGDAADIANVQAYTLFGAEFSYTGNASLPTVSYDQRFLVAIGRKGSRDFYVRVFDLATLVAGGAGDYSTRYLYEWNIDTDILTDDAGGAFTPVQSIACDGEMVYVLSGNSSTNGKRIHAYTIDGVRVQRQDNCSVGLTQAQADGAGTFYEPECLAVYRPDSSHPTLALLIVSGNSGARVNRVWAMGHNRDITEAGGKLTSGTWTPTVSAASNVTASTPFACQYMRVGDVVSFSGRINIQATAAGATAFNLSLPIASDFNSLVQAAGTLTTQATGVTACGAILGDTTNDALTVQINALGTTNTAYSFTGMYLVR
jgi:hypothetical protein